jgi:DNA-binding MarR family transcriptional regulator
MDGVRWLDAAEQQAWRAYLDATRLLIQVLDRQLEDDAGISFTDYELLVLLSEAADRRMRMRDLANAALSTRSGMTRAVTRLERTGWVRRVECEEDRRGMFAELTASGLAKLAATAPGHVAAVRARVFDKLTPAEWKQLGATCAHLAESLRTGR